jgi:hypothetical protein
MTIERAPPAAKLPMASAKGQGSAGGAPKDSWATIQGELSAVCDGSSSKAPRAKALAAVRDSFEAICRGPLDPSLSTSLGDAVRTSKATNSNTDDNKLIRSALAAATISSRIAPPPTATPASMADPSQEPVVAAAILMAAAKSGMLSSGPPLWHRVEACRAAIALLAAKSAALVEGPLNRREPRLTVPSSLTACLTSLAEASLDSAGTIADTARGTLASRPSSRSIRIGRGIGPAANLLPQIAGACGDLMRCAVSAQGGAVGAACAAGSTSPWSRDYSKRSLESLTEEEAWNESESARTVGAMLLAATMESRLPTISDTASGICASLAERCRFHAVSAQHALNNVVPPVGLPPGALPSDLKCLSVSLGDYARIHPEMLGLLAPAASEAAACAAIVTALCEVIDRVVPEMEFTRLDHLAIKAGTLASQAAGLDPGFPPPSTTRASRCVASVPSVLSDSSLAREWGVSNLDALAKLLNLRGVDEKAIPAKAFPQSPLAVVGAIAADSVEAAPVVADMVGTTAVFGSGNDKAKANAISQLPGELNPESGRATHAVDFAVLREAVSAVQKAVRAMDVAEDEATNRLRSRQTVHLAKIVNVVLADPLVSWALEWLMSLAAEPGTSLASRALQLRRKVTPTCVDTLHNAMKQAVQEARAATGALDVAISPAGSKTPDPAVAEVADMVRQDLPPSAVVRVVCAVSQPLGVLRPRALAAVGDEEAGRMNTFVVLSQWVSAALRERSERSFSMVSVTSLAIQRAASSLCLSPPSNAGDPKDAIPVSPDSIFPGKIASDCGLAVPSAEAHILNGDNRPFRALLSLFQAVTASCVDAAKEVSTRSTFLSPGAHSALAAESCLLQPLALAAAAVMPVGEGEGTEGGVSDFLAALHSAAIVQGPSWQELFRAVGSVLVDRGGAPCGVGNALLDLVGHDSM